jgi:hypothetical protein
VIPLKEINLVWLSLKSLSSVTQLRTGMSQYTICWGNLSEYHLTKHNTPHCPFKKKQPNLQASGLFKWYFRIEMRITLANCKNEYPFGEQSELRVHLPFPVSCVFESAFCSNLH